jgi:hypothetical protein
MTDESRRKRGLWYPDPVGIKDVRRGSPSVGPSDDLLTAQSSAGKPRHGSDR